MLVISRKNGQEVVIGDNIRVKVLEVRGNRIRLGIDAPPHVSVNRGELQREMEVSLSLADGSDSFEI